MIAPAALLATAALAAAQPSGSEPQGVLGARPPAPARVQVVATEFELALSRQAVKSGRVIIQLVNYGEDPHDLRVRRIAARALTFRTPEVLPERLADLNVRLGPGRYRLWCSIADHRARGMRAVLTVKK